MLSRSFEAAEVHFERYAALVDDDRLPFVRASSSQRVVDTATNWTAGTPYLDALIFAY